MTTPTIAAEHGLEGNFVITNNTQHDKTGEGNVYHTTHCYGCVVIPYDK